MSKQPVIILGMHRSGTTMITKHLEGLGLFVGQKKEENNEARYFLMLNIWILNQLQAGWDNPPISNWYEYLPGMEERLLQALRFHQSSEKVIQYLGVRRFMKYHTLTNLDFPWGWKDPRNTLTVNLWRQIYRGAKIIHIYRNPIDVAESLRIRKERSLLVDGGILKSVKTRLKDRFLVTRKNDTGSIDVLDVNAGIKLWKKYMIAAENARQRYGSDFFSLKYEDYLLNPIESLQKICSFIELPAELDSIRLIAKSVNPSKRYSFLGNESLEHVYREWKFDGTIQKNGYGLLE